MNNTEKKEPAQPAKDPRAPLDNEACANAQPEDRPNGHKKQCWLDRPVLGDASVKSGLLRKKMTFREVFEEMKKGRLKKDVTAIRAANASGDAAKVLELKMLLPIIAPSVAKVRERLRQTSAVSEHTGVICMDLDHVDDPAQLQQTLASDPYVGTVVLSPGGAGLKVFVTIPTPADPQNHDREFDVLAYYLADKYGIPADVKSRGVVHPCFFSYDPTVFLNEDPEVFPVEEWNHKLKESTPAPPILQEREHWEGEFPDNLRALDVESFLKEAELWTKTEDLGPDRGKKHWMLCPFRGCHSFNTDASNSTVAFSRDGFVPGFCCQHQSCAARTMKDVLHAVEAAKGGIIQRHCTNRNKTCESCDDVGNGRRFSRQHRGCVRYLHDEGVWLIWNGSAWVRDVQMAVRQLAVATIEAIPAEAADARTELERNAISRWADKCRFNTRIDAMLKAAMAEPALGIRDGSLDKDDFLLNLQNGTYDLRNDIFRPHRREDFCTQIAGVNYDSKATAPMTLQFIEEIMGGDKEKIDFLQRALGYSLTGDTSEQVMFACCGSGANGKSTLMELVRALMGDYAQQMDSNSLQVRLAGSGHQADLARLVNKRFVTVAEMDPGRRIDEALVKRIIGGDRIAARNAYAAQYVEFACNAKLWLATNHLPHVEWGGYAFYRRIRTIPFTVTIPEEKRDPRLLQKLMQELPGFLNWCLEGYRKYLEIGLKAPAVIKAAAVEYEVSQDVLGQFLEDRCCLDPDGWISTDVLCRAYKSWCENRNEQTIPGSALGRLLKAKGFEGERRTIHGHKQRGWKGLKLISAEGPARMKGGDSNHS